MIIWQMDMETNWWWSHTCSNGWNRKVRMIWRNWLSDKKMEGWVTSLCSCHHSHKYLSSPALRSRTSSSDSSSSSGGDTTTSGISRWTCGALSVESKCLEDGGVLCGVGTGLGKVPCPGPGRRWFRSMETRESLLWDRLEIEPPNFRRELREVDKPSPSKRREDGEERGGGLKGKGHSGKS